MTAQQLVNNHVLHEQNYVIGELLRLGTLSEDSFYNLNEEIFEWWLVTDYLAELLKAEDETIIESFDCYWWGRTCTGQAIYMDAVIQQITNDL